MFPTIIIVWPSVRGVRNSTTTATTTKQYVERNKSHVNTKRSAGI